jgi:hypothetical protein
MVSPNAGMRMKNLEVLILVVGLPFVVGYLLFAAYRWSKIERERVLKTRKAWTDEDVLRELSAGNYSYAHKLFLLRSLTRGETFVLYVLCALVFGGLLVFLAWYFYPLWGWK